MKSTRRSLLTLAMAGVAAAAVVTGGTPGTAGPAPRSPPSKPARPTSTRSARRSASPPRTCSGRGFDVLEDRDGDYLFVLGDASTGTVSNRPVSPP